MQTNRSHFNVPKSFWQQLCFVSFDDDESNMLNARRHHFNLCREKSTEILPHDEQGKYHVWPKIGSSASI